MSRMWFREKLRAHSYKKTQKNGVVNMLEAVLQMKKK